MAQKKSRTAKPSRPAKPATKRKRDVRTSSAIDRLRAVCVAFPGVEESKSWGNPTFKANGKAFAVLDHYKGEECIWFRCAPAMRETLLKDDAFFAAPYDKAKAAMCAKTSGIKWTDMRKLLRASYELALLK